MLTLSQVKIVSASEFPIHLALGHEFVSSIVSILSNKRDVFSLTHRNSHFNFALSDTSEIQALLDEALALPTGINSGNYGCMTMRNLNAGVIYSSSILGNNIPVGLGISSTLSPNRVAWIQTGDGAIEEGVFYESLVFSKARSLPAVFILEDNNWSLGTSKEERRYAIDYSRLCKSLGVRYFYISSSYPLLLQAFVFALARSICILFNTPSLVHVDLLTIGAPPSANGRAYVSYHHGPLRHHTN